MDQPELTGRVVFPDGVRFARILMDPVDGTIVSVRLLDSGSEASPLIFPGFIDIHVHAREYPRPVGDDGEAMEKWEVACRKETFATAGRAAINGGVTLFAAMPNDPDPPDSPRQHALKVRLSSASPCPVVIFGAVTARSEPWGDIPYKVYLDAVPSRISFAEWKELESALVRYRDCRVFFHAEDPEILRECGGGSPRWKSRPPEAEASAVEKVLELTAKLGLHTHLCHVSTEKTVKLIEEYNQASSKKVTCEVTPHHLFFSVDQGRVSSCIAAEVPSVELLECNPPLRPESDRRYLLHALKEGIVDALASDHAPHTLLDKKNGAPGMPHLDTLAPFAGWLILACGFRPERVAEVLSAVPGRILSADLDRPHGRVEQGAAASFTLLDLSRETLVQGNSIVGRGPQKTLCGWSPFEGIPLPAFVARTIVRGKEYKP